MEGGKIHIDCENSRVKALGRVFMAMSFGGMLIFLLYLTLGLIWKFSRKLLITLDDDMDRRVGRGPSQKTQQSLCADGVQEVVFLILLAILVFLFVVVSVVIFKDWRRYGPTDIEMKDSEHQVNSINDKQENFIHER